MTNYNERLDEILKDYFWPDDVGESQSLQEIHDAAKQAITLLVAERERIARIAGIEEAHKEILEIVYADTGGEGLENFCDVDDVSRVAMSWKVERIAELTNGEEE